MSLVSGIMANSFLSLAGTPAGSPGFKPSSTRKQAAFHGPTGHLGPPPHFLAIMNKDAMNIVEQVFLCDVGTFFWVFAQE